MKTSTQREGMWNSFCVPGAVVWMCPRGISVCTVSQSVLQASSSAQHSLSAAFYSEKGWERWARSWSQCQTDNLFEFKSILKREQTDPRPNLVSERLHYQVSSPFDALLLFWSSEGIPDDWDQHVRLKSVQKIHTLALWRPEYLIRLWLFPILICSNKNNKAPNGSFAALHSRCSGTTHKLLALEEITVVRVCCRVFRHKAEDFGCRWQDGTEGDSGQMARVQQKLRAGKTTRGLKSENSKKARRGTQP